MVVFLTPREEYFSYIYDKNKLKKTMNLVEKELAAMRTGNEDGLMDTGRQAYNGHDRKCSPNSHHILLLILLLPSGGQDFFRNVNCPSVKFKDRKKL